MNEAVIFIYLILMVVVGIWATRRAKNLDDYRLAGRRLGPVMYTGTMAALVIGGSATVGGVGLGYQHGISGMWMVVALAVGLLLLSLIIAEPVRRTRLTTINEVVDLRYGGKTSSVSSLVTFLYTMTLAVNSTAIYASIFVLLFPGLNKPWAVILGSAVVVTYSTFGGMWSITLTDMLQFIFMTLGMFFILLPFSIYHAGGVGAMLDNIPADFTSVTGVGMPVIIGYFVALTLGMFIGQDIWQRVFTSRTPGIAKWGGTAAAIYVIAYAIAGAVIGMAGRAILGAGLERGDIFATLANEYVPPILGGIVMAAAVAAMMSTTSGTLIAAATVTRVDLAPMVSRILGRKDNSAAHSQRRHVWHDRLYVVLLGVIVTILAIQLDDPVIGMLIGYNLLVCGLFVPVMGAIFWKRATAVGAWTAMLAGVVVTSILMPIHGVESGVPVYWGLAASAITYVVVSLLTKPTDPDKLAAWHNRLRASEDPSADPAAEASAAND